MKLCVNCKNEIANEAKFCGHCGAKQEEPVVMSETPMLEKEPVLSAAAEPAPKQQPVAPQAILSAPAPKAASQSYSTVAEEAKAVQAAGQVTEFVKGIEKEQVIKSATEFKQNLFATAKRPGGVNTQHLSWQHILIHFSAFWLSLGLLAWAIGQSVMMGLGPFERAIAGDIYRSSGMSAEVLKAIVTVISVYVSIIGVVYLIKKYVINPTMSFQYVFARFSSYLSPHTVVNLVLTPFALLSNGSSDLLNLVIIFFLLVSWIVVPILVTVTDVEDDKHKVPQYYSLIILLVSLAMLVAIWSEILR